MLIYNADGGLAYSSDKDFVEKDASPELKKAIQNFNQKMILTGEIFIIL